jgi:cell wall integrity and stress response component
MAGTYLYVYLDLSCSEPLADQSLYKQSSEPGSSASPSIVIVTVGGTVQTVTATPTPGNSDSSSGGLAGGAIAGIVIGVLGAIGVAAFFAWMWWSRHKKDESDKNPLGSPVRSPGGSPSLAHTPQMADMSDGRYAASAASGQAAWDSNRRRSHLMPVDPRLDPFIYSSDHNRSRESFTSLQDNQDYSRRVHQPQRVLRAVNPDPEED